MKDFWKNPIFITILIIALGGGGLVYALTKLGKNNGPQAAYTEHVKWNTESTIVLTEYTDLQCPACKNFNDTIMPQLEQNYSSKVKFVFKHFPLRIHNSSRRAAEAAEAASAQGKFWEYSAKLFERQTMDADASVGESWSIAELVGYAKDLGLDTDRFERELRDNMYSDIIKNAEREATDKGFTGTPTITINGEKLENPTYDNLAKKLDELLATVTPAPSQTVTPTPAAQ
jgi:protein-disulfide isomerase